MSIQVTSLPDAKPRVLHNVLTTDEDRESMIAGVRMALEIARQPALKAIERAPYRVPASESEADIMDFVAARVARYKRIQLVEFVSEIPKSPAGKILHRVLKERESRRQ